MTEIKLLELAAEIKQKQTAKIKIRKQATNKERKIKDNKNKEKKGKKIIPGKNIGLSILCRSWIPSSMSISDVRNIIIFSYTKGVTPPNKRTFASWPNNLG